MMADAGSIFSLTSFWVVVAISVIGWPVAIWLKRRRIAREAYERSAWAKLGVPYAEFRASVRRLRKANPYQFELGAERDCFFRGHGRATPDDLREGM